MLDYIAISSVPMMIFLIILIGIKEKKDVFKLFIEGAIEGLNVAYKIFPYILAITVAIGLLRATGAISVIAYPFKPLLSFLNIPQDIVPLIILRPMSGGASMSLVMDIFNSVGPDSASGKIASIIMGGTETTFYTVTVLLGAVGIKKVRGILVAGLIADFVAIAISIALVNMGMI